MKLCLKCKLLERICICEDIEISRLEADLLIHEEKRKFGKVWTVIKNLRKDIEENKEFCLKLKKYLSTGGGYDKKENKIEIMGAQKEKILKFISKLKLYL